MVGADIIGAYSAVGIGIVGAVFGYGRINQKVADMSKEVEALKDDVRKHEERLATGAVAFAHIDEGLKHLSTGQDNLLKMMESLVSRFDRHMDGVK